MKLPVPLVVSALFLAGVTSCASTRHAGGQVPSGFLDDYGRLEQRETGRAAYWASPAFQLEDYSEFLLPNVELWIADGGTDQDNAVKLATLFRDKVAEQMLENGWAQASQPGPGVIEIRIALTELDGANRFGNALTSLPYVTTNLIQLTAVAGDVHIFVGEASTELQIRDSTTREVLAEAIDRRVGAHSLGNFASTWGDVKDALGVFARRIADGLSKTSG